MTLPASGHTDRPGLPHWETTPDDPRGAIREVKAALRSRIAASGRSVEDVFAVMEQRVRLRAGEIAAEKARGETVWPVIDYADIAAGTVTPEQRAMLHQRGCLVVRGHFDRDQALGWDRNIVEYVESNHFFESYRGPGRRLFRHRRLQARDLPGLLVSRPDGGPAERPHGPRPGLPQRPVDQRVRRRAVVRPGP